MLTFAPGTSTRTQLTSATPSHIALPGLGVVQHLQKAYPTLSEHVHVYAISSGNLASLCFLLGENPKEVAHPP